MNYTREAGKVAQISTVRDAITCPRCAAQWGGLKTAHCTDCHQTFTVQSAADRHRTGSHAKSTRTCVDPASVGLVDVGRPYPCWGFPKRAGGFWLDQADDPDA